MLRLLAPLIQTPRSAKRLTNVYRLLRVTQGESRLLDQDSYVVVLLLLGIVVGYPRQSSALLTALEQSDASTEWAELVRRLSPTTSPDPSKGPYRNDFRDGISQLEVDEWVRMIEDFKEIASAAGPDLQPAAFQEWLQPVAAYTFHPWAHGRAAPPTIPSS